MRRRLVIIHAFLALQLAAPLSYYACREDVTDERFAWRMFSSTRMVTCRSVFTVADEPVRLPSLFHEAWLRLAGRGRLDVVHAMAARLCADNPGQPVRVQLTCQGLDGTRTSYGGGWDYCTTESL